ncbi:MAG: sigma 54-interacting transcriptional regulator [Polyangiaceae bacterium]|nr:sigma 54-interacting transcriptional regulator [Polyangiaceae bacterium]
MEYTTSHDSTTARFEVDDRVRVRRFRIVVVDVLASTSEASPSSPRPELVPGRVWESTLDRCSIGAHPCNDLALPQPTVSRFHCEVIVGPKGFQVVDCKSQNGTVLDGVRVQSAFLRHGSILRLGQVVLRFELLEVSNALALSSRTEVGKIVGRSQAMRSFFAFIEVAARRDSNVLLYGETGTGKTTAAEAIHQESKRRGKPFLVVDCGAVSTHLIDDELFGHEKDAFTGATKARKGVFEAAEGGTVFLDEIGELPKELQSKLLRVLENREVRRLGSNESRKVNVRVIAATLRDLRADQNAGRFRADLYQRLAVLQATIPPLRERPDDIPVLVNRFLHHMSAESRARDHLTSPEILARLMSAQWPGNVRELGNHIECCVAFGGFQPILPEFSVAGREALSHNGVDSSRPFEEEQARAHRRFLEEYLNSLMDRHEGNVTRAAEEAGLARGYLHRLLKKVGRSCE